MVKNILRVRHAAQNAARRRFQAIANPSHQQIQSHQDSIINHNKRIKQWNKFMNISKNLIKNVNNSNNTPNNLVTRYRKNLRPTNFPNKASRRNMIKAGKNGIISYQVREGEGNRFGPGRGFEYYNSNGRLYNHWNMCFLDRGFKMEERIARFADIDTRHAMGLPKLNGQFITIIL